MTETEAVGTGSTRSGALERRYRLLLRAYPRDYRERFGDEFIGTLLETTPPGRALPGMTESAALVRGGLRTRIAGAAHGPPWPDGLHLGLLIVSLADLGLLLPYAGSIPLWVCLSAGVVLAVAHGRVRLAMPLVLLVGSKTTAIALGRPWLDQTLVPVFPDSFWGNETALYGMGGPITPVITHAVLLLGLLVLAVRPRPPRRRFPGWWALAPLVACTDPAWLTVAAGSPRSLARVGLEAALLLLAVWAGAATGDPRWAVAAVPYVLVQIAVLVENFDSAGRQDVAHWALLGFLAVTATAVPYRSRAALRL
ncbi:hypothetical protein [Sphaerimonospora mesophila]|uniref:hypothetical protein n=1 Tax=Sphaerimonospora mesophila TaxID=37483 RepID=UPI0006E1E64A